MSALAWVGVVVGTLVVLFVLQMIHLSIVLAWSDQKTRGLGYFGLSADERDRFRTKLRNQARLLFPILRVIGRPSATLDNARS